MFSKELELSIASLFDKAHEANIQYLTVEHLLLMILSDYEVDEFFKSKTVSAETIKNEWTEAADIIMKSMDRAIGAKKVTYDFARMMKNADLVSSSGFADEMIKRM